MLILSDSAKEEPSSLWYYVWPVWMFMVDYCSFSAHTERTAFSVLSVYFNVDVDKIDLTVKGMCHCQCNMIVAAK